MLFRRTGKLSQVKTPALTWVVIETAGGDVSLMGDGVSTLSVVFPVVL